MQQLLCSVSGIYNLTGLLTYIGSNIESHIEIIGIEHFFDIS